MTTNHACRALLAVLCIGAIGCALVSLRHARLQAAHELAQSHRRAVRLEAEILELRSAIVRASSIEEARAMTALLQARLGPLVPEPEARIDRLAGSGERIIGLLAETLTRDADG